ncbi:nuclear transport factor 2 family protein [Rhodococcus erythropolis]
MNSDRDQILDVLYAYASHLDKGTPEGLGTEVFAADAVIDLGYGRWEGRERLVREYSTEIRQFGGTAHILTNARIQIDSDTAVSSIYVTAWHWPKEDSASPHAEADFVTIGVYLDKLERREEGWRITHRRFRRLGPSAIAIGRFPDFIDLS